MTATPDKPTVLVTGSSGLIGTKVIENLSPDYHVVGLDIDRPDVDADSFTWMECDLTDDESVKQVLHQIRSDVTDQIASVVHLAAYYDFSGEPSPLYEKLTVEGTRRLLMGLQTFEVEQFIFSSTLLVMKSSTDGKPITALSPLDAEWDYPKSKLETEEVIKKHRGNIPAIIIRLAGVYDEGGHSVPLAQQMARIYEKQLESYMFPGDKSHGQSFIHLEDTIDFLRTAVEKRKSLPDHEVLVAGEEDVMSYEELQERLGELIHGKEWPAIRIPKAMAKAGAWAQEKMASDEGDAPFIKPWMIDLADQNYPISLQRVRAALQWEPKHTLRATLPAMVQRMKQDPAAWYKENGLPMPDHLQSESARS